ncbi:ubiquinone biosynthesis regulatory protein kinase UbiB [Catenovulum sp. 2E275]|uniref:ubiquinone biosynthesis regulatory protein kinase UbiB n=1 Tax=Catenovulum sp. 2E275 TaxID=2980497 RepID=UPI0021CE79B6|nr:ubiquinone biosynthesis regulatory protein kinase UbiB [Catenovulum sp. 2E275]MCU4675181.1 ubiquinone biosynthesis regulatory protein kinase UbiB [Catenovulum sp. 2E275]
MSIWRFYIILKTLLTYGLDELIPERFQKWHFKLARNCIFWLRNRYPNEPVEVRLRLALQSLGPVFIKFGQMLSTRRDLLPPEIANELKFLQDKVSPFDGEQAKQLIEKAWKVESLDQYLAHFEVEPLASASIAQVHTAKLKDDINFAHKDIVIKVIRPKIAETMRADVELMKTMARLLAKLLPDGKRLRPVEVIREYQKTLFDELDLMREAANTIQLKRNFADSDSLYVPAVYSDLCRNNVMVMERIYGIPVGDIAALEAQNTNMKLLAERGVEIFFTQVFRDSFFHADMHPGNIFVSRENPQNPMYIGIDCGIVGTLNKNDKRYLADNFIAFFNRDYRKVAELHVDSGWVPRDTNVEDFEFAIRTVCEPIFEKPLAEISFGHVLLNLFNTARRFQMEVQPQLVLLQKTLLYIEGLGRQLYPQLDLWKTAKPFLENWVQQQVGLPAIFRSVKENAPFWGEKLPELPDLIYDALKHQRQQQDQQQALLNLLQQQKQQQNKLLPQIGHLAALSAVLIYCFKDNLHLSLALLAVAVVCWTLSKRK